MIKLLNVIIFLFYFVVKMFGYINKKVGDIIGEL